MKVKIPYGKQELELKILEKNVFNLVSRERSIKSTSEKDIIKTTLSKPISSPLLKDLAKGKVSAAILVSDITRPCPSYKFLSYLIDELKAGGIDLITIVLGLGIHRSHAFKEKVKLVGNYALENAAIIDSDPERCKLVSCQYKYIGY